MSLVAPQRKRELFGKASDYVVLGSASGLRHFLGNSCSMDYCMVFPYEYPSKLFVS